MKKIRIKKRFLAICFITIVSALTFTFKIIKKNKYKTSIYKYSI